MNNFAIIYSGTDLNIAAKMVALKSNILKTYSKVNLWYVFNSEIKSHFNKFPLVIDFQTYEEYKNNFVKICKLESNTKSDCVEDFCMENDVNMFICNSKKSLNKNVALITTNIKKEYISKCQFKYPASLMINPNLQEDCNLFDTVIGKESFDIIACGALGKKVYILEPQLGFNSFQKMFPDSELFECMNDR
jgi:hypothetical protein